MVQVFSQTKGASALEKGERLKSLRIKLGYSVHEFSRLTKIPGPTLYSWEKGRSSLSLKGAKKILKTVEPTNEKRLLFWLINGEDEILGGLNKNILEEVLILQDVNYFLKSRDHAAVMIILDHSMDPFLSPGDYVGGIKKAGNDMEKYSGRMCIIETRDHTLYTRYFEKTSEKGLFSLRPHGSEFPTLQYKDINFIAPLTWIRKRD